MERLLIQNIGLLATPAGHEARRGPEQGEISMTKNAWLLAEDGVIAASGVGAPPGCGAAQVLDAQGRLVTPGLVDAHTHLVFGGWRQNELGLKLHGVSYLEILSRGGGILSTVEATRAASEEMLVQKALPELETMLRWGTTTCEIKSGYGLATEQELKQLRVIRQLQPLQPVELAPTFMGAHAVPAEYREDRAGYLRLCARR